jgi:hypothetical protein
LPFQRKAATFAKTSDLSAATLDLNDESALIDYGTRYRSSRPISTSRAEDVVLWKFVFSPRRP